MRALKANGGGRNRAIVFGPVLCVAILLTGCSSDGAVRSSLSQSASVAASASRAAGLVLGLNENDQILGTVADTGLSDSADRLASEAKSVAVVTAVGGIATERDRILADIRAAQDTLISARDAASAGKDGGDALDKQRARLDELAQELDALAKKLEHQ
ncbi:hypothetical protein [Diaminobutyricibacter sp. McL0608]|uniref:hypothetical protein n=1 Tax=Leifsonia sp. McL0608 TaxID=3143537 RepID=UPI0031F305ED